jgi:hypothetical protein
VAYNGAMMKIELDRQDLARIATALKLQFMYGVSKQCADDDIHDLIERFEHLRRVDASKN